MFIKKFIQKHKISIIFSAFISVLVSLYGTFVGVYNLGDCKGGTCSYGNWHIIFLKFLVLSFVILLILFIIISQFIHKKK
jgi:hypothetical protein